MNSATSLQPELKKIHQALSYIADGKTEKSLELFDSLPLSTTDNEEYLVAFGTLAYNLAQYAIAIEVFSRLTTLQPDNLGYHDRLATTYITCGRTQEALFLLKRNLQINPDYVDSLINISKLLVDSQDYSMAIEYLERARKQRPNDSSLLINLIIAYNQLGRLEDALNVAHIAERVAPSVLMVNRLLGTLTLQTGDADKAIKYFKKELRINKTSGQCYWGIASSKRTTEADRKFVQETESALQESMPSVERQFIHFALGRMYDDLKQWDKAFQHYRQGNLLRRAASEPLAPTKFTQRVQRICTPLLKENKQIFGNQTHCPVFVLGMPRTGSTLVEQIISSHPEAETAGELITMHRLAEHAFLLRDKTEADIIAHLGQNDLEHYADQYLAILKGQGRENASRVIDKSPGNFYQIGFILMLFPNAKLIHTIRHPLDTLLSCYFQPFGSVAWSNDLAWEATSYRLYRKSIAYWKRVLPPGQILDVHYENVVAHPEEEARRIIDACGLAWHPDCLDFFNKEGSVRTASTWQVRQPIYQSSKMRWVHYAEYLGELAKGIRPYLSTEDITILREHHVNIQPLNSLEKLAFKWFGD